MPFARDFALKGVSLYLFKGISWKIVTAVISITTPWHSFFLFEVEVNEWVNDNELNLNDLSMTYKECIVNLYFFEYRCVICGLLRHTLKDSIY